MRGPRFLVKSCKTASVPFESKTASVPFESALAPEWTPDLDT